MSLCVSLCVSHSVSLCVSHVILSHPCPPPLTEQILEQSVWILGNLAGEGAASRDAVLDEGVLTPIGTSSSRRALYVL